MTAWNPGAYFQDAFESLLAQTFENFEFILIDNGSTDGSVNDDRLHTDKRIRFQRLPQNIGRTPALRLGAQLARGEYIAVLDADDVTYPERLARQVAFLDQQRDVVVLGCWCHLIDKDGQQIGEWSPPAVTHASVDSLAGVNPIMHSSVMYRRDAAEAAGGYPTAFPYAQDFALWLAMSAYGRITVLPEYLTAIRILSTSLTRGVSERLDATWDTLVLHEQISRELPLTSWGRRKNRRARAVSAIQYGWALFRNCQRLAGLRWILTGVARDPKAVLENNSARRLIGMTPKPVWD